MNNKVKFTQQKAKQGVTLCREEQIKHETDNEPTWTEGDRDYRRRRDAGESREQGNERKARQDLKIKQTKLNTVEAKI